MTLAGVENVIAICPHDSQDTSYWLDRRAGQRDIIAHAIDITADSTEVDLHVDDDECGVKRLKIAVIWPLIGIGIHVAFNHHWLLRIEQARTTPLGEMLLLSAPIVARIERCLILPLRPRTWRQSVCQSNSVFGEGASPTSGSIDRILRVLTPGGQ